MNKSKLILRSLLLMLILWAVNALVLKWPVHVVEQKPEVQVAKDRLTVVETEGARVRNVVE